MSLNLFKFVNIPVFIISLAFGIFAVYITVPATRKILIYPTTENVDKIQYRDKTHTCFSVQQHEVSCPANANEISKIPAQS